MGTIHRMAKEPCFEIEFPQPTIRSIIIDVEARGLFKIDIHGVDPAERFDGGDTLQTELGSVIRILNRYIGSQSIWVDYETREPVDVWDALAALAEVAS
jgi:hypothetical protein